MAATCLASSSASAVHAASAAIVDTTAASGAGSISASVPTMRAGAICVVSHPATSGANLRGRRVGGGEGGVREGHKSSKRGVTNVVDIQDSQEQGSGGDLSIKSRRP
eukprot:306685-Prorocentrum_minimum.AAC.1